MASLRDWLSAHDLLHPLAVADVVAVVVAVAIGFIRPSPLLLGIRLVLTFAGRWTFAVFRRAVLAVSAGASG